MGTQSVQRVIIHLPGLAQGEELEARLFRWFGFLSGGRLEFCLGIYPNLITPWNVTSPASCFLLTLTKPTLVLRTFLHCLLAQRHFLTSAYYDLQRFCSSFSFMRMYSLSFHLEIRTLLPCGDESHSSSTSSWLILFPKTGEMKEFQSIFENKTYIIKMTLHTLEFALPLVGGM
jgi:hypothetical protein